MFVFIRLEMSDKKITIKNPKNHEFVNEVGTAGLQHMVSPPPNLPNYSAECIMGVVWRPLDFWLAPCWFLWKNR